MESLNDMFFTATKQETLSYDQILDDVQKYCTSRHADKLTTEGNQEEARKLLREFICQYILSRSYHMEGMTTEELCDTLYEDMAGISFLKKWIYRPGVEEVNVNAYDDIEVIMSGGRSMKIPDRFQSPQHAIDVTRRLLNTCGMVIDDTMPSVIGFLDKNIRISVDKTPIVDAEVGINASIRIVNQQTVSREKLTASGSATDEMLDLLTCCIRYGVSVCIAGSTGSGKTTIMSWLLSMVPDNRRLITIEEGSREFDLIRRDGEGHALNSVVHLLTRPHENPSLDIDQDLLLERVLRKHPDVIGVGEMRSAKEALSVAESSRTGHTVVTTIHSNSSESTYRRMMTLAKRKYNMADEILMQIMVEAYPIVVFTKQLEDGSRKIMQIIEGEDFRDGQLLYRPLYQYDVTDNCTGADGNITVVGKHRKLGGISDTLKRRMLDNGIPAGNLPRSLQNPPPEKPGKEVQHMQWIQIILFLLIVNGLFTLFAVRFNDFFHVLSQSQKTTLQDDVDVLLGKPAKGFFNRETLEVEQLLAATGRQGRFTLVKRVSILLFALGAVTSLLLNNPFLIPILGAGFAFAPVWYLRSTAAAYKKHLNEELETAISVITTSYLRSGDL